MSFCIALQSILALTTGPILSMWFAELLRRRLGNGSSMLIFINIVGSLPNSFSKITLLFNNVSYLSSITVFSKVLLFYILVIGLIVVFQDAYKKIDIISAKQLSGDESATITFKNSYIPLKINQGGIMPLVFSSTIAIFFVYPIQLLLTSTLGLNSDVVGSLLRSYSTILNVVLVIFLVVFMQL